MAHTLHVVEANSWISHVGDKAAASRVVFDGFRCCGTEYPVGATDYVLAFNGVWQRCVLMKVNWRRGSVVCAFKASCALSV